MAVSPEPTSGAAPANTTAPARIIWRANGLGLAELGTVGIVLWRGAVTSDTCRRQIDLMNSVCERYPGRGAMLCVLEDTAPPPNEALRQEFVQAFKSISMRVSGLVVTVESTGFLGAVKRSVLAGIAMLLPRGHAETKVVASVLTAASWIAPRSEGASVAELCALVEDLRKRMPLDPR